MQPTSVAGKSPRQSRSLDALVVIGVPLATALVVIAVLAGEDASVESDLQLVVPSSALPGAELPVRAIYFAHPEAPEGPTLAQPRVRVALRDAHGTRRAVITLHETPAQSLEGVLHLPAEAGRVTLEADARGTEELPAAVARAVVSVGDGARPLPLEPRRLAALSTLSLGPVRPAGAVAPELEVRVVGGTCVPETTCVLLLRRAAPCTVRVVPNAALDVPSAPQAAEAAGVEAVPVTVHGPEATGTLAIVVGGVEVAQRDVRLPVALGEPSLRAGAGTRLLVEGEALGDALIVDLFDARGFWIGTKTVPSSTTTQPFAPPFALPAHGRVTIQVRGNAFSSESAAVRVLDLPAGPPEADLDGSWERALLETSRRATPQPASGRVVDDAKIEAARTRVRWLALVTLVACAAAIGAWLAARGLRASAEARALMAAAGDETALGGAAKARDRLVVVAIVFLVLAVFVALVAFVLVRTALPS